MPRKLSLTHILTSCQPMSHPNLAEKIFSWLQPGARLRERKRASARVRARARTRDGETQRTRHREKETQRYEETEDARLLEGRDWISCTLSRATRLCSDSVSLSLYRSVSLSCARLACTLNRATWLCSDLKQHEMLPDTRFLGALYGSSECSSRPSNW